MSLVVLLKGTRLFKLRWKNYGPEEDPWEAEENLACDELLDKYWKAVKESGGEKGEGKSEAAASSSGWFSCCVM